MADGPQPAPRRRPVQPRRLHHRLHRPHRHLPQRASPSPSPPTAQPPSGRAVAAARCDRAAPPTPAASVFNVGDHDQLLAAARADWRSRHRHRRLPPIRPMVERSIAWLVANGHRRVRYRGVERNRLSSQHPSRRHQPATPHQPRPQPQRHRLEPRHLTAGPGLTKRERHLRPSAIQRGRVNRHVGVTQRSWRPRRPFSQGAWAGSCEGEDDGFRHEASDCARRPAPGCLRLAVRKRDFFARLVPGYMAKYQSAVTAVTRALLLVTGISFLVPKLRLVARWGALVILLSSLPEAINQVRQPERMREAGVPPPFALARVPVQGLMIAGVWRATRPQ